MDTRVYALKSWTIRKRGDEFYIAPTAQDGRHSWRGPYATLQRATTAIARKLQWEFARRNQKMVQS